MPNNPLPKDKAVDLEQTIEAELADYGAKRASAYREHGDSVKYTVIAENLKKQTKTTLLKAIQSYVDEKPSKRKHLKKNDSQSFCGWGTQSGAEFEELVEDATCKTCIRLSRSRKED